MKVDISPASHRFTVSNTQCPPVTNNTGSTTATQLTVTSKLYLSSRHISR